jgi:hypothetical protein
MKTIKHKPLATSVIKLRIDYRTIITVRTKEAAKIWKEKYPGAVEVI